MFQGSIFLGDGFLLTHEDAKRLCGTDPRNAEVIMPIINGKELNNEPNQAPGRSIINFRDWPLERAQEFDELISIVGEKVKPSRIEYDETKECVEQGGQKKLVAVRLPKGKTIQQHPKPSALLRRCSHYQAPLLLGDADALCLQ